MKTTDFDLLTREEVFSTGESVGGYFFKDKFHCQGHELINVRSGCLDLVSKQDKISKEGITDQ